jgi:hypothetical protein
VFPDDVTGRKESGTSNGTEIGFDGFNPFCLLFPYGSTENFRNIFNDGNHKSNLEK